MTSCETLLYLGAIALLFWIIEMLLPLLCWSSWLLGLTIGIEVPWPLGLYLANSLW